MTLRDATGSASNTDRHEHERRLHFVQSRVYSRDKLFNWGIKNDHAESKMDTAGATNSEPWVT